MHNDLILIRNASENNLQSVTLAFPKNKLIVVTGVSGSGKSSLVYDVVQQSWEKGRACGCSSIRGFERFQRVVSVLPKSQFSASIGTPATFTGIFDRILPPIFPTIRID